MLLRRLGTYFSRYTKISGQQLNTTFYHCKNELSDIPRRLNEDEIPHTLSKYELFSEGAPKATLDVEEERKKVISEDEVFDEFEGINLQRGVTGVFDVEEIVSLLKKEKGEEVVAIKIPSEYVYADYMVIVSGRSVKHMLAMSEFIRRIYKRKVGGNGCIPKLEGKKSNTWMAIDLGNIILHVFSKSGRYMYDLESLWTVGKDFDTLSQKQSNTSVELITDYEKILASLTPKS